MRPAYLLASILVLACDADRRETAPPRSPAVATQTRPVPPSVPFSDYAVADMSLGRRQPVAVDVFTAPYGRMYRTKLREGAATGPNFAGQYTAVVWGCGTGCQIVSVVDARTGRLSAQTLLTANGVEYRRDSRLLFADPPTPDQPADCASCGTPALYEWRDGRFDPVGAGPHPHTGGPRPWLTACAPADIYPGSATGHYTCPTGESGRAAR